MKNDYIKILNDKNTIQNLVIYNIETIKKPYKIVYNNNKTQLLYGEYIKNVVDNRTYNILEEAFVDNLLNKTNKIYNINNEKYPEYIINGKKYIRITAKESKDEILSNDENIVKNKIYWLNIDKIIWDIIETKDKTTLISEDLFIKNENENIDSEIKESHVSNR